MGNPRVSARENRLATRGHGGVGRGSLGEFGDEAPYENRCDREGPEGGGDPVQPRFPPPSQKHRKGQGENEAVEKRPARQRREDFHEARRCDADAQDDDDDVAQVARRGGHHAHPRADVGGHDLVGETARNEAPHPRRAEEGRQKAENRHGGGDGDVRGIRPRGDGTKNDLRNDDGRKGDHRGVGRCGAGGYFVRHSVQATPRRGLR